MANGISREDAVGTLHFHMGIGLHYFLEMAKFRAARALWEERTAQDMSIQCRYKLLGSDGVRHVRKLGLERYYRSHVGCHCPEWSSMEQCCLLIAWLTNNGTDQSSRLARNIQIVLKEEARVQQSGGSPRPVLIT